MATSLLHLADARRLVLSTQTLSREHSNRLEMPLQTHREINPKVALLTEKRIDMSSNSTQISSQPTAEIPDDDRTGEDDVAGN